AEGPVGRGDLLFDLQAPVPPDPRKTVNAKTTDFKRRSFFVGKLGQGDDPVQILIVMLPCTRWVLKQDPCDLYCGNGFIHRESGVVFYMSKVLQVGVVESGWIL